MKYIVTIKVSPRLWMFTHHGADFLNASMREGVLANTMLLKGKIQQAAPVGVYGILRKSIGEQFNQGQDKANGRVYIKSSAPYGLYVELGTKGQHNMPPLANIMKWVSRKLPVNKSELRDVAFRIALSIKRKGIKSQLFMLNTFQTNYEKIYNDMVSRIIRTRL